MADSIKLFQFFHKVHQIIGIYPSRANTKQCSINPQNTAVFACFSQVIFTTIAFAVEAKSMFDFGFGFFVIIDILNSVAIYLLFVQQLENTLEFIKNCERFLDNSV